MGLEPELCLIYLVKIAQRQTMSRPATFAFDCVSVESLDFLLFTHMKRQQQGGGELIICLGTV